MFSFHLHKRKTAVGWFFFSCWFSWFVYHAFTLYNYLSMTLLICSKKFLRFSARWSLENNTSVLSEDYVKFYWRLQSFCFLCNLCLILRKRQRIGSVEWKVMIRIHWDWWNNDDHDETLMMKERKKIKKELKQQEEMSSIHYYQWKTRSN